MQSYKFLQARFIIAYMALGVIAAGAIYADYRGITAPTPKAVRATAASVADARIKAAIGSQDVVAICERSISAAVQQAGLVVTGYKNPVVRVNKDGSVHVTVILEGDPAVSGPGHCDLNKGVYQVTGLGPGA